MKANYQMQTLNRTKLLMVGLGFCSSRRSSSRRSVTPEKASSFVRRKLTGLSVDGDFNIFGDLAHKSSFMVYLHGINLNFPIH